MDNILPKCKAKPGNGKHGFGTNVGANIYIAADGYVTPCCWMGTTRELRHLWKECGLDPKLHNIDHYTIQEIIDGPIWAWIDNNMGTFRVCQKKCVKEEFDDWTHMYKNKKNIIIQNLDNVSLKNKK